MSETNLVIPESTVECLVDIAAKFSSLNTGAVGDEFWIGTGGGGGYSWEQFDIGVNKAGRLITCYQSGCSCNSPESPTADREMELDGEVRFDTDCYEESGKEAVEDLIKTTDTLYKVLNDMNVTPSEIIGLPNAEIRRAVIELIGYEKLTSTAKTIDTSEVDGDLMVIPLSEDEDIYLLHVKDPSTTREYYLRVPPKMKTAKQARAWTFGFDEADFNLEVET